MPLEKRRDVTTARVGGELLIRSPDGTALHHLNPTATCIWDAWDGRLTTAELAAQLVERFDVCLEVAMRDVERVLGELSALGLLADSDPSGG